MAQQYRRSTHGQKRNYWRWGLAAVCLTLSHLVFAACDDTVGRLESSEGRVSIEQAGRWQPLAVGACIPAGVRVQVTGGRAVFRLANETLLRAADATLLRFAAPEHKSWIRLFDGIVHFITRTPHAFDVQTDYVNAGVKGTEFILAANSAKKFAEVIMFEGDVLARNEHGEQHVYGGSAVIAHSGQAPHTITIPALRDAVQWTLYYPPLPTTTAQRFQPALQRFYRNDIDGAIAQLASLPTAAHDADYYTLLAAIELHRGATALARTGIKDALERQPGYPPALALSAVIALTTGDPQRAAALLEPAQSSRAPSVLIARSYLEQSRFHLDTALANARQAAAVDPQSALIQARLAELALMNDDTTLADKAAHAAITLQPDYARAHAILGFTRLQQLRFDAAAAAFARARALDAADPLPRLGLGLIAIRHNHVSAGREQLAIAVALDPGQSLLRSYLGKAYQEEGRDRLASDQYTLAKHFDAADPTPWLYSALLARAQSRPFDALDDLQKSIALNDNRAVYRSRLQLDADAAARTASQADIYNQLGFNSLARQTAARAVSTAPGEYGGHRMLAEAYADDPQYDAARASEVLQAELLQPLSATPVLPLLGETNLLAVEGAGPSALGFREYNAMFTREKPWLSVSGLGGSNHTGADEVTLSGIYDRYSYALAQYNYESLGYRDNNDARYDVLSAYTKFQANEDVSFLLHINQKKTDRGDIEESLSKDPYLSFREINEKSNSIIAGSNIQAADGFRILSSVSYREGNLNDLARLTFFDPPYDSILKRRSRSIGGEIQAQINARPGNFVAGADWSDTHANDQTSSRTSDEILQDILGPDTSSKNSDHYRNIYTYFISSPISNTEITAGIKYAELDSDIYTKKISGIYPKVSANYSPMPTIKLRAAYFQSLKPPFEMEQTLEPTQIGGVNQFFDEAKGIESDQYEMGYDLSIKNSHHLGGRSLIRKSKIPFAYDPETHKADLTHTDLFWDWTTRPFAISLSYSYEKTRYHESTLTTTMPSPFVTQQTPFSLSWISDNGLTLSTTLTYVSQKAEYDSGSTKKSSYFTSLDVAANRHIFENKVKIGVKCSNLLNKSFNYQNVDLYDPTPLTVAYIPERTIFFTIKIVH